MAEIPVFRPLLRDRALKLRIATAAVLLPIVLWAVYTLSVKSFLIAWGAVVLAAAWEWSALVGIRVLTWRLGFVLGLLALQISAWYWPKFITHLADLTHFDGLTALVTWGLDYIAFPTVLAWLALGVALRSWPDKLVARPWPKAVQVLVAWFVLFSAWLLMARLRANFGNAAIFYLLFLVWLADTGAFFVGKKWGRTPLAAAISPGKTLEGVYGAMLVCALYTAAVGYFLEFNFKRIADFVILALIAVLVSICGDLLVSLYKRWAGVKDAGRLLPGHGGLLDRIDSLLAACAVVYAGFLGRELFG
nr:phosphatidate cytidylyltransferase [uncultured Gammaproteobacteria bacterium]